MLDQDGYDMPSPTAASAPLTTLDHGSRLSQVILNSQTEPGYQYAQTMQQPAPQAYRQSNDANPGTDETITCTTSGYAVKGTASTGPATPGVYAANSKGAAPAPTRGERAIVVGNGMQETSFGMLNETDSDSSMDL